MDLKLPAQLGKIAAKATLTLDYSKLGPMQKKEFLKMARTGSLKGYSAPQQLATFMRRQYKLPIVTRTRYSGVKWENANQAVYDALQATAVAQRMTVPTEMPWANSHPNYQRAYASIFSPRDNGEAYYVTKTAKKTLFKSSFGSSPELEAMLDDLETGRKRFIEMSINY